MLAGKKIVVIGAGKLGETLVRALLDAKAVRPHKIAATTRHRDTSRQKSDSLGIRVTTDNGAAVRGADVIIISVKPSGMAVALKSIKSRVSKRQVVISTAAGVPTHAIEKGRAR